jgi:hypothetical protein
MRIEEGLDATGVEEVELFAVDDEVQDPVSISCLTGCSTDLVDARDVYLADESDDNATTVGNGVDLEMSGFGFVAQEVPFEVLGARLIKTFPVSSRFRNGVYRGSQWGTS